MYIKLKLNGGIKKTDVIFLLQLLAGRVHMWHIRLWLAARTFHLQVIKTLCDFTKNSDLHTYNTHSKNEPHFQLFTTSLGQRSIKFKGCQLWCSLPDELRSVTSTGVFKTKLKQFLQTL